MSKGYLSEIFVSFQGEGVEVGRRHLFVRLAGCNLRCRYCDTPDSLERAPQLRLHNPGDGWRDLPNPVTCDELLLHLAHLASGQEPLDGTAVTGGEPLLQADFLAELLRREELPRPRLLETNGMLPEGLALVLPWVDMVSMDIKLPSNTGESAFWQEHARFLQLCRGKVYVKLLVDAGTAMTDVERAAELVRNVAPETPVFLQPIADRNGHPGLCQNDLTGFYRVVRRCVGDIRVLPQIHKIMGFR